MCANAKVLFFLSAFEKRELETLNLETDLSLDLGETLDLQYSGSKSGRFK